MSTSDTGSFVRHPRDRIRVLRALTAPAIMFWPLVLGMPSGAGWLFYFGPLLLIMDLNYTLHSHVHRAFSSSPAMNRILDLFLGSVTGMTSANWRIQHVYGHHAGRDEPFTWHRLDWTLERYTGRGALLYSFGSVAPTFWGPMVEAYRKGVLQNLKEPIDYRAALVEQIAFLGLVVALAWLAPLWTFAFLLPWYVLVFAMTRYVDYLNHYGCGTDTFDCANNSLNRSFNRRMHNFGYHTAHHLDPAAHWTELPLIHASIEDRIPPEHLKGFSWSSALFPNHVVRAKRGAM